jgi:hypothetical protein
MQCVFLLLLVSFINLVINQDEFEVRSSDNFNRRSDLISPYIYDPVNQTYRVAWLHPGETKNLSELLYSTQQRRLL